MSKTLSASVWVKTTHTCGKAIIFTDPCAHVAHGDGQKPAPVKTLKQNRKTYPAASHIGAPTLRVSNWSCFFTFFSGVCPSGRHPTRVSKRVGRWPCCLAKAKPWAASSWTSRGASRAQIHGRVVCACNRPNSRTLVPLTRLTAERALTADSHERARALFVQGVITAAILAQVVAGNPRRLEPRWNLICIKQVLGVRFVCPEFCTVSRCPCGHPPRFARLWRTELWRSLCGCATRCSRPSRRSPSRSVSSARWPSLCCRSRGKSWSCFSLSAWSCRGSCFRSRTESWTLCSSLHHQSGSKNESRRREWISQCFRSWVKLWQLCFSHHRRAIKNRRQRGRFWKRRSRWCWFHMNEHNGPSSTCQCSGRRSRGEVGPTGASAPAGR